MSWVIGIEFCWVPSHCGLYWNEILNKLAKQGAIKTISEILFNNLLLSSREIASVLEKTVYKEHEKKVNTRHLVQGIYKCNIQITSKFLEH